MTENNNRKSRVDAIAMFAVSFFSLLLLVYVGAGEGQRTFTGLLSAKLAAQGEIIQNAMAGHLRAGLPVRQFVGFQTISGSIFESDETVALIQVTDRSDKVVFANHRLDKQVAESLNVIQVALQGDKVFSNERYEIRQSREFITVILPLRNKFEEVGRLWVLMPRAVVQKKIGVAILPLIVVAALLSALFSGYIVSAKNLDQQKRMRRQQWGLTACFLLMSGIVISLLVLLYSEGAQAKAKALASSLRERVGAVPELRIDLTDIEGVEKAFADYRSFNKDIQAIGLSLNETLLIHTNPAMVGKVWEKAPGTFEFMVNLSNDAAGNKLSITVSLPVDVVYKAVASNAKNFIVLFFASAFLAALFLHLANAIRDGSVAGQSPQVLAESALEKCKPVLFLAVFVDNLSASFLPQLIRGVAQVSNIPPIMVSVAFMAYFVSFALSLVPAGKLAQRVGSRPLLWSGSLLIAFGLVLLAFTNHFVLIVLARVLAGVGQGILFIGVQTLVLTASSASGNQTKANGIIVYNFNAGMVSGMAIGSLLVLYMGSLGVFLFGGLIVLALAVYSYLMIPMLSAVDKLDEEGATGGILQALRSFEFLRTMLLVGIPSKAVLTGVIIFGLPILLSKMAFESDEIGQIIMFYAAGVLVANHLVAQSGDGNRRTGRFLAIGMFTGAVGLMLIGGFGLIGSQWIAEHDVLVAIGLVLGVLAVGLGHGAINAPVVTHVANSDLATRVGVVSTTALYRVLERIGHIIGPMIVGQLLLLGGQSMVVIGWVGLALLIFTLIFFFGLKARYHQAVTQ